MGISNLLPSLKSITTDVNVSKYANKKVAIDTYCWLHKAVYSCSTELCQNIPTEKYINYCLDRVKMMKQLNITPVLVFDGAPLPIKGGTNEERRINRAANKEKGLDYLRNGNTHLANKHFQRSVSITPEMSARLIRALEKQRVEYIVAPYEADAELAYLSRSGYVHSVISEDSDLLAYGCERVLFKMDRAGNGQEIELARLGETTQPSFKHFSHDMFRRTCILAGCDYLPSIKGLGIAKAHTIVKKYQTSEKILEYLKYTRDHVVPNDYVEGFRKAEQTFLYQRVFDPIAQEMVHLHPLPAHLSPLALDFLGPYIPPDVVLLIAMGRVHPATKVPFEMDEENQVVEEEEEEDGDQDFEKRPGSGSQFKLNVNRASSTGGSLRTSRGAPLPVQKNLSSYFTPQSHATRRQFVSPSMPLPSSSSFSSPSPSPSLTSGGEGEGEGRFSSSPSGSESPPPSSLRKKAVDHSIRIMKTPSPTREKKRDKIELPERLQVTSKYFSDSFSSVEPSPAKRLCLFPSSSSSSSFTTNLITSRSTSSFSLSSSSSSMLSQEREKENSSPSILMSPFNLHGSSSNRKDQMKTNESEEEEQDGEEWGRFLNSRKSPSSPSSQTPPASASPTSPFMSSTSSTDQSNSSSGLGGAGKIFSSPFVNNSTRLSVSTATAPLAPGSSAAEKLKRFLYSPRPKK
eukprot:TRINITY_DN1565_c2_g1_i1.p1 TRINITY_DN1565_c2_g1~~TRINITY_DN1565_c2_g1_i1.p1  ORF type:complete len:686 (+),score=183.40 TRINITY_DN1565_c2_g1_i1:85-2142(+)